MARAQWEERRTLDGVAYYYNKGTDALTWVKPDELKSDAERSDSDVYHFEYDKSKGWIPKRGKGKWAVTKLELQRHEDDVVMLEHINEAMISHNIRKRYDYLDLRLHHLFKTHYNTDTKRIRSTLGAVHRKPSSSV